MESEIDEDLRALTKKIVSENKTEEQWSKIESDDMFQSGAYEGGYDADEKAFTFSYYDGGGREFWFQLTLPEVEDIAAGRKTRIEMRPAE